MCSCSTSRRLAPAPPTSRSLRTLPPSATLATFAWFDDVNFAPIPGIVYNQANVTVTSTPVPNIVVTDNDAVGPADPVQFGNVDLSVDATLTVTVTNSGNAVLNVSSVTSPTP